MMDHDELSWLGGFLVGAIVGFVAGLTIAALVLGLETLP